ncbi:MAG: hypothetical protein P8Y70_00255 [Candidatus Lokiarchaeota archaeon]
MKQSELWIEWMINSLSYSIMLIQEIPINQYWFTFRVVMYFSDYTARLLN